MHASSQCSEALAIEQHPEPTGTGAQRARIALMHVVIVTSCELACESLMGVRPCQVKVHSACWHCCCQVCPFSVFSKMPHLLRFSLQFDSTNTRKLQDLDVWFFFRLSARPRAQEDSFKVEGHSGRQQGRGEAPVHERGSRRRQSHCR